MSAEWTRPEREGRKGVGKTGSVRFPSAQDEHTAYARMPRSIHGHPQDLFSIIKPTLPELRSW